MIGMDSESQRTWCYQHDSMIISLPAPFCLNATLFGPRYVNSCQYLPVYKVLSIFTSQNLIDSLQKSIIFS